MNLVGINFYFYILEKNVENISNLTQAYVKTGLGGTTGNKGSCCINFDYKNTNFSIACSHLAAGESKNKQRISELTDILNLKLDSFSTIENNKKIENIENTTEEEKVNIQKVKFEGIENDNRYLFKNSDIWIILGDLNFRVDMEYEEFSKFVKTGNEWTKLLDFDQFNKFILASLDLKPIIQEDKITFPPTYKYIKYSDEFDYVSKENKKQNESGHKKRKPSWCDRILYKKNCYITKDGKKIIQGIDYKNVNNENFQCSDHRPIYQIFDVIIFKENNDLKKIIEGEIELNEKLGISNKYMKKYEYDY
jgi:hypothetical protein